MNTTQRTGIMQRWNIIQHELMPELRNEVGALTPKLMQVVHTLEWVRIEEFVSSSWSGCGRPEHDLGMLSSAFVAKAVLGISTTAGLIERLAIDRALRRICGFSMWKSLPSEATFSRAFAEFAKAGLAERTHAALVRETLGEQLIGHISRDGTAIEARERPAKRERAAEPAPVVAKKRGRPCKDEIREVKSGKEVASRLPDIPSQEVEALCHMCDFGFLFREYKSSGGEEFLHQRLDLAFQKLFRAACDHKVIRIAHQIDLCLTTLSHCVEQCFKFALQTIQCDVCQHRGNYAAYVLAYFSLQHLNWPNFRRR